MGTSLTDALAHPTIALLQERLSSRVATDILAGESSRRAAVAAIIRVAPVVREHKESKHDRRAHERDTHDRREHDRSSHEHRKHEQRAELLFIKRAEMASDPWSGHIAFPGGRHDASDASLLDTAVRETREELALDITAHGQVIGRLDDLSPQSRALPPIIIRPFVAVVQSPPPFILNHEVADAFWVPIEELQGPAARMEYALTMRGVVSHFPAFRLGEHVLWGLTERIVSQLLGVWR